MKWLHILAFTLVVVGGLNWLGFAFGLNLVHNFLGFSTTIERGVYLLVGLSAVYLVVVHKKDCRTCAM